MLCTVFSTPIVVLSTFLLLLKLCESRFPGDWPNYVFRGDSRSPDEIRQAGGFLPHGETDYSDYTAYSLTHHIYGRGMTAYVSTSTSFGQAARNFAGPGNYVYRIQVTPNMIDVNQAVDSSPFSAQEEAGALGGIPWSAVQAWWRFPEDDNSSDSQVDYMCLDDTAAHELTMRYAAQFEREFVENADFEERPLATLRTRSDGFVSVLAAAQPDEMSMELAARQFMDRYGTDVGWHQGQEFPLWHAEPLTAEPLPSPCRNVSAPGAGGSEEDLLTDDDLMDIATTVQGQGGRSENEPCSSKAVHSSAAHNVAQQIKKLRTRLSTDSEEEDPRLAEAESALQGLSGGCVLLALCAASRLPHLHERQKREGSMTAESSGEGSFETYEISADTVTLNLSKERLTPGLRDMCVSINLYDGSLGPWQYGGNYRLNGGVVCNDSHDYSQTATPCETFLGTEVYCSRAKDRDACFSLRQPPPFLKDNSGCRNRRGQGLIGGPEDCIGTKRWCEGRGSWLRLMSSMQPDECKLRRTPASLAEAGCARIEQLSVEFRIVDNRLAGAGTFDAILLSIGRLKMILAIDPSAGFSVVKQVPVKRAFGSPAVSLQDIKHLTLLDKLGRDVRRGDPWQLEGITMTGKCLHSSRRIEMKKYRHVHTWLQHGPGKGIVPVWSANIYPDNWTEVTTEEYSGTASLKTLKDAAPVQHPDQIPSPPSNHIIHFKLRRFPIWTY
ncbi:Heat-labile enterotoxin IIA, A chain [Ophiocordyceps camponoti-floridani]|uniref:Heat-labile enterotoxin IIA, A chain n=1 Tax=Ophiocordyceps camponoti-floridani TaxID=2030778 RepID=A0A8H4Q8W8_9HYPO|nr:Heat-labile enterotoxin IIA, A chain [Ophiocordyceps camponoti-floridani]